MKTRLQCYPPPGPDSNRESIHVCFLSSHPRSLRGARPTSHFSPALPCLYKHQCSVPHLPIQNRQRFRSQAELTLITTMERCGLELDLPGFRFHPTEEELLDFYLRRVVLRKKLNFDIIGTLNIYRHDPWELPNLAKIGEREWYFFVPRERKQASSRGSNRVTERGFWKATGTDKPIRSASDPKRLIGLKKTLVFYMGRVPRGSKTDWVMNEYRLPDPSAPTQKEDIVLCKIYRKATSLKELEQRSAMKENPTVSQSFISISNTASSGEGKFKKWMPLNNGDAVKEVEEEAPKEDEAPSTSFRPVNLPPLQVNKCGSDWMHESFLTQLCSPWLEQWSPSYLNMLDFEI